MKTGKTEKLEKIFLQGRKPYLWIVLIGFVVYFRSIFFTFSYFDDNVLIIDYLFFLKNPANLFKLFTMEVFHIMHGSAAFYRPILTISFMIDSWISGASPYFYHFTNLVLHLFVSATLFLLLKRLKIKKELSFLFSLIFVVHPVLTMAVSWIPGRNDSLLALFVVASLINYIAFTEKPNNKNLGYLLLFSALAIFTKESGILVPFLMLSYTVTTKTFSKIKPKLGGLFLGWGIVYSTWFFMRQMALDDPLKYTPKFAILSVINNFPATFLYIGKIIFPINLSVLPTLQDSSLILGIVATLLLVLAIVLSKQVSWTKVIFGCLIFVPFLASAFVRPSLDYVPDFLEHRVYLPIVGFFIIISQISFIKKLSSRKVYYWIALGVIISVLAVLNIAHNGVFKNSISFWENAVENSPSHPLAHKNLGAMYYLARDFDAAESHYLKSLELNPQEIMIHNNLGLIHFQRGELEKAEEEYKKELEINPLYYNAFFNWGLLKFKQEDIPEAEKLWLRTLEIHPEHEGAYKGLLQIYLDKKDSEKFNAVLRQAQSKGLLLNIR